MSKPTRKQRILIAVADSAMPSFGAVVAQLRDAGLDLETASEVLGTVTGAIEPDKIAALAEIAGVAQVERARQIRARGR